MDLNTLTEFENLVKGGDLCYFMQNRGFYNIIGKDKACIMEVRRTNNGHLLNGLPTFNII